MRNLNQKEDIFQKLISEFYKKPMPPFRVFLISNNQGCVIYTINDKSNNRQYTLTTKTIDDFGTFITIDRGKILEKILQIEFLLSQIIFIYINDRNVRFFDPTFGEGWNDILEKISFSEKIRLLNKWKLKKLDSKTKKHLETIKVVRNQFAHTLNKNYIYYDGGKSRLKDNKNKFGDILTECWINLLNVYQEIWNQEELAKYILDQLMEIQKSKKN